MMTPEKNEIELSLLSRLKVIGCILIVFSFASLFYAKFGPSPGTISAVDEEMELSGAPSSPKEQFNFYAVSAIFAAIGCGCILLSWKRKRAYENPDS